MKARPWWHGLPGVVGEVVPRCPQGDPLPRAATRVCERSRGRTPANCIRCERVQMPGEPFRRLRCAEGEI